MKKIGRKIIYFVIVVLLITSLGSIARWLLNIEEDRLPILIDMIVIGVGVFTTEMLDKRWIKSGFLVRSNYDEEK